ncbi:MAG: hypothetical protein HQM10_20025 [Candidatus Riflebacteria bacterium]|nr:hypothetical protein [Candidatus Riflebacteria bacterium]
MNLKKLGYTVLEVTIAGALMSCLFVPLFTIFRTATSSFASGAWKINVKSEASAFFQRMNFLAELSGNAHVFDSSGLTIINSPIRISKSVRDRELLTGVLDDEVTIAFMNVTSKSHFKTDMPQPTGGGAWLAMHITASHRKLTLQAFNSKDELPLELKNWVIPLNTFFVPASRCERKMPFYLNDLFSIKFSVDGSGFNRWLVTEASFQQHIDSGPKIKIENRTRLKGDVEITWF